IMCLYFFVSSRRRHTRFSRDWSSDVCSSDLYTGGSPRSGFLSFVEQVPVLNGIFLPFQGFFDLFQILQGVVQIEDEFRDPPELVFDALGQVIADAGLVGPDAFQQRLGFGVGEDAQIDLGHGKVRGHRYFGNRDQRALEAAIGGRPLQDLRQVLLDDPAYFLLSLCFLHSAKISELIYYSMDWDREDGPIPEFL